MEGLHPSRTGSQPRRQIPVIACSSNSERNPTAPVVKAPAFVMSASKRPPGSSRISAFWSFRWIIGTPVFHPMPRPARLRPDHDLDASRLNVCNLRSEARSCLSAVGPNRDARVIRAKRPLVARPSRPAHRLGLYRDGVFYVAIGWNVDVQVGLPAGSTPITFCSASVVNVPFD